MGRLAVDQGAQGLGLGPALLLDAITRAARAEPAILMLLVDSKDDAFYWHLGFRVLASRPRSTFLPIAEAVRRLSG